MLTMLGSVVLRHADDVNKPLVKLPVGTKVRFRSDPHEQRLLLNAFALENYLQKELGTSTADLGLYEK